MGVFSPLEVEGNVEPYVGYKEKKNDDENSKKEFI